MHPACRAAHARPCCRPSWHQGLLVDAYRVALPQLAAQGYRFEAITCTHVGP